MIRVEPDQGSVLDLFLNGAFVKSELPVAYFCTAGNDLRSAAWSSKRHGAFAALTVRGCNGQTFLLVTPVPVTQVLERESHFGQVP